MSAMSVIGSIWKGAARRLGTATSSGGPPGGARDGGGATGGAPAGGVAGSGVGASARATGDARATTSTVVMAPTDRHHFLITRDNTGFGRARASRPRPL